MLDADPERRPTMQQASEALSRLVSGATAVADRDERQSTKVLPISGAAAAGAAAGAAAVLGSEGGHTVELPSDPPIDQATELPIDQPDGSHVRRPLDGPCA